jgi:NhaP-type Na+/H+ or K+/H+ antiporter
VTFGIVLFTLIVQGSSAGWVVRRSGASTAG